MGTETENTVSVHAVPGVGVLTIVRRVDLDALVEMYPDGGAELVEAIQSGGSFAVKFQSKKRGSEATYRSCTTADDAAAYVAGFESCASLNKREPKSDEEKAAAKAQRAAKKAEKEAAQRAAWAEEEKAKGAKSTRRK